MGGGAAMRAAAKAAALPSFSTAFRNGLIDSPVSVAARNAATPTTVCDGSGIRLENSVKRLMSTELDEWEFASVVEDEKNELFVNDKNDGGSFRVVFGGVPSIEESLDATHELKDALEKIYLSSPKYTGIAESAAFPNENKACIARDSVPKGAMQAFQLLNESPAAQTAVASIASDPNVWLAVMQNPAFNEFLESDRKETQYPFKCSLDAESNSDSDSQASEKSSLDIDNAEEPGKLEVFMMGLLNNVKVTVVDLVTNLTSVVDSLFFSENKEGISFDSPKSIVAGGTFMALAMMVIIVVPSLFSDYLPIIYFKSF